MTASWRGRRPTDESWVGFWLRVPSASPWACKQHTAAAQQRGPAGWHCQANVQALAGGWLTSSGLTQRACRPPGLTPAFEEAGPRRLSSSNEGLAPAGERQAAPPPASPSDPAAGAVELVSRLARPSSWRGSAFYHPGQAQGPCKRAPSDCGDAESREAGQERLRGLWKHASMVLPVSAGAKVLFAGAGGRARGTD